MIFYIPFNFSFQILTFSPDYNWKLLSSYSFHYSLNLVQFTVGLSKLIWFWQLSNMHYVRFKWVQFYCRPANGHCILTRNNFILGISVKTRTNLYQIQLKMSASVPGQLFFDVAFVRYEYCICLLQFWEFIVTWTWVLNRRNGHKIKVLINLELNDEITFRSK